MIKKSIMKLISFVAVISIVLILSFIVNAEYDITPHAFYGTVKVSSTTDAPVGTVIKAVVDGERRGTFTVTTAGIYGGNGSLKDDTHLLVSGNTGEVINFLVCTVNTTQSYNYEAGGHTNLDLSISSACPTTTTTTPTGGGGSGGAGSGGGGGAAVVTVINLDLKADFSKDAGYTAIQTQGNTVTFTVAGTKYTAKLTTLRDDSVTITIGDQSKTIKIGGSAEFDVNQDGVIDVYVMLKSISGGKAEIVYKSLTKTSMMGLLDILRDFYSGNSDYTMMDLLDVIRSFYGG